MLVALWFNDQAQIESSLNKLHLKQTQLLCENKSRLIFQRLIFLNYLIDGSKCRVYNAKNSLW